MYKIVSDQWKVESTEMGREGEEEIYETYEEAEKTIELLQAHFKDALFQIVRV
ncbi:hypothetical protein [Bacillus badius]|uniref:hypothetical protein n=1 Tax=Bacillus badius TaxID=1455 RepID=UPI000AC550FF|nr:hypothetical protein [Bacillus badius]